MDEAIVDNDEAVRQPGGAARDMGRMRRVAGTGFATLVVLAFVSLAVLATREGVSTKLLAIRWWGVAGALALSALGALSEGAALAIMDGDLHPRRVLSMTRAYVTGSFVGALSPYGLGSGPTRMWALTREGANLGEAAALVAGRTVNAGLFFTLMGMAAIALTHGNIGMAEAVSVAILAPAAAIGTVVFATRRPDRAGRYAATALRWLRGRTGIAALDDLATRIPAELANFADVLGRLLGGRPLVLPAALSAFAVARFCQLLAIPLLLFASGHNVPVGVAVSRLIVVWVVSMMSPTPNGEGVAQVALVGAFGPLAGWSAAAAAAIAWRTVVFYPVFAIGGVLFARLVSFGDKPVPETATEPAES